MLTGKIQNIQFLRAVAALMVVFHHAAKAAVEYGFDKPLLYVFHGWGASGVDLFFVISGFIMVYISRTRPGDWKTFAFNRVTRIAPTYWALTILLAATIMVLPSVGPSVEVNGTTFAASMLFSSIFVFEQNPIIYVGWTIEYEMLFYAIFTASLFVFRKRQLELVVAMSCVLVMLLIPLGLSAIVINFVTGMILGLFVTSGWFRQSAGLGATLLAIGIALHLLPFLFLSDLADSVPDRVIWYSASSLLIVAGCLYLPQMRDSFATLVGDASYSLYLIQVFTIPVAFKVVTALTGTSLSPDLVILATAVATIIAGIIFYKLFEKPTNSLIRHISGKTKARTAESVEKAVP